MLDYIYCVRGGQVRYTSLLMWKATSEFLYFVPQWWKYRGARTDVGSGDAKTSQTRRYDVFVVLVVLHDVMTASWRFTTCKLAATSWGIRKKVPYCGVPPTVQRRAFMMANHAVSFCQLKGSSWHTGRNVEPGEQWLTAKYINIGGGGYYMCSWGNVKNNLFYIYFTVNDTGYKTHKIYEYCVFVWKLITE